MTNKIEFKEQIVKLVQLQELDLEIFDLEYVKGSFPERIREKEASLENKKELMNSAEEELKELQVSKNGKETDMQAKEEKIRKHEGELYQIKNNKEYQALKQEIESIKADLSIIEEDIIGLFDKIEAAEARREEGRKLFEEERQKVEEEKEKLKAEENKISEQLKVLTSRREEASVGVEKDVLRRYEGILKSRGRIALARVYGECCSGCNMQIPPQIVNEAKLKINIVVCGNCSRILYVEE